MDEADGHAAQPWRARLLARPLLVGLYLALLFWWPSLTPTLIPRPWIAQAVISGTCIAIGYAVGTLIAHATAPLAHRWQRHLRAGAWQRWWIAWGVLSLLSVGVGAVFWTHWQNDQRAVMGMASLARFVAVPMVLLALAVGVLLVLIARAVGAGLRALSRKLRRRLPPAVANGAAVALVVLLAVVLAGGAAFRGVTALANWSYAPQNDETAEGITVPTASTVSGGPGSLVSWESLGRTGREFVATATPRSQLEAFHGSDATLVDPVRAYVGLLSADSLSERADLAVRELERAGGFDRAVLVVWVPTGSGWVIDEAAEAVEQLYGGDTAIVAIQYSFLPSLLSVFMEPGLAIDAGAALFDAVERRWLELPPDDRPKLLVFGKSLGTSGVEAPFAAVDGASSLANLVARADGALIVGAKYDNPIHSQLTSDRDPGSPVWQPVVDGGRTVRFLTRDPDPPATSTTWPSPRVVYLQHPSDPVTFWGLDALWRPPEWMDQPRGYDVPSAARWFPIVSGVQAVGDLIYQLSPPPGFGHDFSTDYVTGWANVLPPATWTVEDTRRLETFLDRGDEGESSP